MGSGRGCCRADSPPHACQLRTSDEVVVHILRFPVGERKSVFVEYGAVDDDAVVCGSAHRILWDEGGVHLFCTGV